jgi:hypothetical protein
MTIGYDAAGERTSVTSGGAAAEIYGYTPDGYLSTVSSGGQLIASYGRDLLGRETSLWTFDSSGSIIGSATVTYDVDGNMLTSTLSCSTNSGSSWGLAAYTSDSYYSGAAYLDGKRDIDHVARSGSDG